MSLPQILGKLSQNLGLKGMAIASLTLGLVLSLPFAINLIDALIHQPVMAQISLDSHHTMNPKTIQQSLFDHPFLGVCIALSGISFLIVVILVVILSLQPIFINPAGKTSVIDSLWDIPLDLALLCDILVDPALAVSSLLLSVLLLSVSFSSLSLLNLNLTGFEGLLFLVCFMFLLSGIYSGIYFIEKGLIQLLNRILTRNKGRSWQPLFCIHCRKKINNAKFSEQFFNPSRKNCNGD